MFTGIIEEMGSVERVDRKGKGMRLTICSAWKDLKRGESIAVNGLCLTVVENKKGSFTMDLSPETLRRSTLGDLKKGDVVNLERPLRPSDRLGGHFVTGHIDGVGTIETLAPEGNSVRAVFIAPPSLSPYLVEKGSVAIDGISLTVGSCEGKRFTVFLIPYTIEKTNFSRKKVGDRVNIEVDILGKYIESFLKRRTGEITVDLLEKTGFI